MSERTRDGRFAAGEHRPRVAVRLSVETLEAIDAVARSKPGKTRSDVVRDAVDFFLAFVVGD